jgi:hypothetical protein
MRDPERIIERQDGALAGTVLRSLKSDEPSVESRRRAVAAAALAVASLKTGVAGAAGSWLTAIITWGLSGALLGGAVSTGAVWIEHVAARAPVRLEPPSRMANGQAHGPPRISGDPPIWMKPVQVPAPSESAPAVPRRPKAVIGTVPALPSTRLSADDSVRDLRDQRLLIEEVRHKLSQRRPGEALAKLDEYRARFRKLSFYQESVVLRIEALLMSGERARARSIAQAFLDAHPDSPLSRRVRSLVGLELD